MDKVKTIEPRDWMITPATQKVMATLGEGSTLFVGGCVRNVLLGTPVTDVDIATKHHPEQTITLLEKNGIKAIPTGVEHGTITAIIDDQSFEITTLRKDVETDGRRAVIAFADTWEEDSQRRDFTINTLLMNEKGEVSDPTEQGIEDLERQTIRFVGDPEERILEDILRILRFFRFHATYGKGAPEDDALKACAKYADKIPELSKERITQEFLKIIELDNPENVLRIMRDNGILLELITDDLEAFGKFCKAQSEYDLKSTEARLFVLNEPEVLESFLILPNKTKKAMKAIDQVLNLPALINDHAIKVSMYKHGRDATAQALMIEYASVKLSHTPKAIDIIQSWDIPNFPITGDDLIKEGIPKGPELGRELKRREEEWIKDGFRAT